MTEIELERINAICAAATPGPWANPGGSVVVDKDGDAICDCLLRVNGHWVANRNALFIATARGALPELVDEVERLRVELEAAKRDIKNMLQSENCEEFCAFCKRIMDDDCSISSCNAEWRGMCAENGGAE